jgi:hypothetical protein
MTNQISIETLLALRDSKLCRSPTSRYGCDYCNKIICVNGTMISNRTRDIDVCVSCLATYYETKTVPRLLQDISFIRVPIWKITQNLYLWNDGLCHCMSCKKICYGSIHFNQSHLCFRCLDVVDGLY